VAKIAKPEEKPKPKVAAAPVVKIVAKRKAGKSDKDDTAVVKGMTSKPAEKRQALEKMSSSTGSSRTAGDVAPREAISERKSTSLSLLGGYGSDSEDD
jgi:hypothetical protein